MDDDGDSTADEAGEAGASGADAATSSDEDDDEEGHEDDDEEGEGGIPLVLDVMEQYAYDRRLEGSHIHDNGDIWGEYTPASFVDFSDDPDDVCHHMFDLTVKAPLDECFDFLGNWWQLTKCFDLIDTVIPDGVDEEVAMLMLFYKWRTTPPLQILMTVRRLADEGTLAFFAEDGMPFEATVLFDAVDATTTRVRLDVQHAMPLLIKDWVGMLAFDMHIKEILTENLEVFRLLLEKELAEEDLEAYHAAHRSDAYNGPETDGNTDYVADLPELELEHYMPEGREAELDTYVDNVLAMEEAVAKGMYVETDEGYARADLTPDEVDTANEMTAFYRYFSEAKPDGTAGPTDQVAEMLDVAREQLTELARQTGPPLEEHVGEVVGEEAAPERDLNAPNPYDEYLEETLVDGYGGVTVVDEEGDEVAELPVVTRAEVEAMSRPQQRELARSLAVAAGMSDEWDEVVEKVMLTDEEDDLMTQLVDHADKASAEEAEAAGMTQDEWVVDKIRYGAELVDEAIADAADEAGVHVNAFAQTLTRFEQETQERAEALDMSQEEYVLAVADALDGVAGDIEAEAAARGVASTELLGLSARIADGAEDKAAALGMSVPEYTEYAWAAVRAARDRRPAAAA